MTWLLLATTDPNKGESRNAVYEKALLDVLVPPLARTSVYDQPTAASLAAIRGTHLRLAVCAGGPILDPRGSALWNWGRELNAMSIRTVGVGATGLTPEQAERPNFAAGPLLVCAADAMTVQTVRQALGSGVDLVGNLSLLAGLLYGGINGPTDTEHLIIGFGPFNLEFQRQWFQRLVEITKRPIRVIVHGRKEWAVAAQIASYAPSAQIRDAEQLSTLGDWAAVLTGGMCVTANAAEALAAASLGTPTIAVVPSVHEAFDASMSVFGPTGIPVATLDDGQSEPLDPEVVLDHLTTLNLHEHLPSVQGLIEWMHAAELPVRPGLDLTQGLG